MPAAQTLGFYHDPAAPVQPDQLTVEFETLLDIYRGLAPRRVLEIGVREGGTLYQWIANAAPGALFVAVEIGMGGGWANRTMPDPSGWISWAQKCGSGLIPIIADSHEPATVKQARECAPFDFVFIDGDHSYHGIMCDFLAYSQLVRPGGVVALHDILPNSEDEGIEIWRYWPAIQAAYRTQELTGAPDQRTRGIGVVYV